MAFFFTAFKVKPLEGCLGGSVNEMSHFGSGHDLVVHEFKPRVVLRVQSLEPASDSVSPSLSAPPLLVLALSLSLSKINIKKILSQASGNLHFLPSTERLTW